MDFGQKHLERRLKHHYKCEFKFCKQLIKDNYRKKIYTTTYYVTMSKNYDEEYDYRLATHYIIEKLERYKYKLWYMEPNILTIKLKPPKKKSHDDVYNKLRNMDLHTRNFLKSHRN